MKTLAPNSKNSQSYDDLEKILLKPHVLANKFGFEGVLGGEIFDITLKWFIDFFLESVLSVGSESWSPEPPYISRKLKGKKRDFDFKSFKLLEFLELGVHIQKLFSFANHNGEFPDISVIFHCYRGVGDR